MFKECLSRVDSTADETSLKFFVMGKKHKMDAIYFFCG